MLIKLYKTVILNLSNLSARTSDGPAKIRTEKLPDTSQSLAVTPFCSVWFDLQDCDTVKCGT
jgi:hypothetical protein